MRMPQKEFLEKSLEMREEPERRETSSIDERRFTMDLPPSNPSEIKIKENLLEFNIVKQKDRPTVGLFSAD